LWDKGGLKFTTLHEAESGSNDGSWYVDESWIDPISKEQSECKPILVVEGTFGTETGNVGDAQKTKISHVIDLPQRGILSAILMPKRSEYYTSGKKSNKPKPIYVKPTTWLKSIVMMALAKTEKNKDGAMLFIDAYDKKQLEDLVYALAKQQNQDNEENRKRKDKEIHKIICDMTLHVHKRNYAQNYFTKPLTSDYPLSIFNLPMKNGKFSSKWIAKIHSHDVKAFGITTGKNPKARADHRDEHILLGNIIELSILTGKKTFLLLPRWNKNDLKQVRNITGEKKEFNNLEKDPNLDILTMDDIDFGKDTKLKDEFKRIRKHGIKLDAKLSKTMQNKLDHCCVQLKWGLYSKKYKIKR
jgi:hypothetical protein